MQMLGKRDAATSGADDRIGHCEPGKMSALVDDFDMGEVPF
jgi:hypothetical protein